MNSTVEKLRKTAEEIRNTAQSLDIELKKVASDNSEPVELDPKHVLNFLRFFGA